MKLTKVVTFHDERLAVTFEPTAGVPGFSHRVTIHRYGERDVLAKYWLGTGFAVNARNAAYFLDKFATNVRE